MCAVWSCALTVQQSGGDGVVETIAAVAAVATGNLIIIRTLQGEVRGRALLKLPLQDPTHPLAPPAGHTCTEDKGQKDPRYCKVQTICTTYAVLVCRSFV